MKLEQQVCSLELAKKLKELGVKQESEHYWGRAVNDFGKAQGKYFLDYPNLKCEDDSHNHQYVSAFSVAELGGILPCSVYGGKKTKRQFFLRSYKTIGNNWQVAYFDLDMCLLHDEFDEKEADARAKMLVHLIENKLLPVKGEEEKV